MPHTCPDCARKVFSYGFPAYKLLEKSCKCFFAGECLVYRQTLKQRIKIETTLRFLELKGYLLSHEIDDENIAIIPNIYSAWQHPEMDSLCWCHLEVE